MSVSAALGFVGWVKGSDDDDDADVRVIGEELQFEHKPNSQGWV